MTKNTALALKADMEMVRVTGITSIPASQIDPAHMTAAEIMQLSPQEWLTKKSVLSGSKMPAEPGLKMTVSETTLFEQKAGARNTIFGLETYDRISGLPISETARTYEVTSATVRIADVPVMYFPYLKGNANDPFGPLQMFSFQQSTMFGYQFYTTWDVLELIGLTRLPAEHWGLMLDYLTARGPGFGTNYRAGKRCSARKHPIASCSRPMASTITAPMIWPDRADRVSADRHAQSHPLSISTTIQKLVFAKSAILFERS